MDRRAKRIFLTAAGEPVPKAIDPVRQKFADQPFAALDDQEQEQLTALVGRLNLCLQQLEENLEQFSA
jgi:DNA-binding MarR family transcriptional regulator